MSTPSRNSILRSMGADPKEKTKSQRALSTHSSSQQQSEQERDVEKQGQPSELDLVQKELDDQRKSAPTPTYLVNGNQKEEQDQNQVKPVQSRSSVVPPEVVLSRADPVARPYPQIQSRNTTLPPLASDQMRKPNGDLITNDDHKKSSLGKFGAGKLSKILGGGKKNSKDGIPPRDTRMKRYSERPTAEDVNATAEPQLDQDASNDKKDGEGAEEDGKKDSRFVWANRPEPVPEKEKIRSYRKPRAVVSPAGLSQEAPQIKEDVIHQDRINLEDNGVVESAEGEGDVVEDQQSSSAALPSAAEGTGAAAVAGAGVSSKSHSNGSTNIAPKTIPRKEPVRSAKNIGKRSDTVAPLRPEQRHYLLKALVHLQVANESEQLEKLGALTYYGFPFATTRPKNRVKDEALDDEFSKGGFEEAAEESYADEDQARRLENISEPLLYRQMFHVNLLTFPGLDEASTKYWQLRVQTFLDEMAARNFSTSLERSETTKRHFFANAIARYLGNYYARGFGVRGEGELRGPGPGEKGSERWGVGKGWGKGTVKRGLDRPVRPNGELMERIDNMFGQGTEEAKVWRLAGDESARIRRDWNGFKENIVEKETGLEEIQQYLEISTVKNLPPHLKNSVEYARIHAAYLFKALFHENGDGPFNVLKGIHTLFPYWGAKQLLQYANAGTLINGILSLLLARPAGAKSLVQRVISFVLGGEISAIQKDYIKPLKESINDSELCEKVEAYVKRGKRAEGKQVRARAEKDGDDVLTSILIHSADPVSSGRQYEVRRMQGMFANSPLKGDVNLAYPSSCPITKDFNQNQRDTLKSWHGNEKDYALRFAQLKLLLRETLKVRDREQAIKVASGSLIVNIIRDSLALVFYQPIKTIASTADLSGRLGDLQSFIDDLIALKKTSNADHIEDWIALAARHENSLYYLFHECTSISKPFFDWAQIGCDYMAMGTTDPIHPADRRAKRVEINLEELLRDGRVSPEEVNLILKEVDQLTEYSLFRKVRIELETRRNYLFAKGEGVGKSGLTEYDIPSQRMKEEISDIDGLLAKIMNDVGVKINDGELKLKEGGRGTEERDFPWAYFDRSDLYGQSLRSEGEQAKSFYTPLSVGAEIPAVVHIRKLLPAFREHLSGILPNWQDGDRSGPAPPRQANGSNYAPSVAPSTLSRQPPQADARSTKSGKSGLSSFFKRS